MLDISLLAREGEGAWGVPSALAEKHVKFEVTGKDGNVVLPQSRYHEMERRDDGHRVFRKTTLRSEAH